MNLDEEILLNKFGQNLITNSVLTELFVNFDLQAKRVYLTYLVNLIMQSKVKDEDIDQAILESKLRACLKISG